ncbi:hypothetical protein BDV34DRAFT_196726 [Aspergillus parasiticus]|uniref:Uncharacterized protein n=1 Tax=Aspergillus parasiticus TaxID=5067 RepID=A0A5N6DIF5_ASPPA|nr:hypothetical protein BDV34DRAFT_196726 [Aspergillus parasiticus]
MRGWWPTRRESAYGSSTVLPAPTPSDLVGASMQGSGVKNNGQPKGTHPILFHLYQSLFFIIFFLLVL